MINKKEIRYIMYAIIFAIVYFFLLLPALMDRFVSNNPLVQFFIFNLGIMIFITIYLKSRTLDQKIDLRKALEYTLVVMAIDIFLPEYHVGLFNGVLEAGGILGLSTTDYFFGLIGQNFLQLKGIMVSIWTYIIVPALLFYFAGKVSKSNFVRQI